KRAKPDFWVPLRPAIMMTSPCRGRAPCWYNGASSGTRGSSALPLTLRVRARCALRMTAPSPGLGAGWSSVPARRSHYRTGSNGSVLKVRLAALDVLDDLRLGVLVDGGEDPRRVLAGLRCALADGDNGALADDVLGRADQGDLLDLGAVDHVVRHAGVQREVGVEDRDVGRDLVLRAVVRRGDLAVEALRLQQQG